MKTGLSNKSGKLLLMSIFLGLIISILLFLTLNSILLSISIFAIFIIFPARNYKIKTKSKIKFDNHLKIKINPKNPDIVELEFSDKEYAKSLEEINLSQIKLKQEREAKEKREQEVKEKREQEAKEKSEQVAKEKQQQITDSIETQKIVDNIENGKSPVEITITEPVSGENHNIEQRKTCPKCKIEIKSKWVFCLNCGTPLNK
jgi:preprotein translocase subunit SecF